MQKNKRDKNYLALYLSTKLCIAIQNLSKGVNVVSSGSPSRIRIVLLISFGITTRPRSSILLTIPVAFIFTKISLLYKFVLLVSVKQADLYFDNLLFNPHSRADTNMAHFNRVRKPNRTIFPDNIIIIAT